MKYNAEQVAFMLAEAIDENREYKSWHVSTQHLMTLVERVVAAEREACAKLVEPDEEHRRDASWGYLGGVEGVELLDTIVAAIRARGQA